MLTRRSPLFDAALPALMTRLLESADPDNQAFATRSVGEWLPAADSAETEDGYTLALDLPGVRPDDVKITFEAGWLTIEGERKEDEEDKVLAYRRERPYGRFVRRFRMPLAVDGEKIQATYDNGTLAVTLPKAAAARTRNIEIRASSPANQSKEIRSGETSKAAAQ